MFTCDRCEYETNKKYCIIKHLRRKNICDNIKNCQISNEEIIKNLNDLVVKCYYCNFCDKKYKFNTGKSRHQKICKNNPELNKSESKSVTTSLTTGVSSIVNTTNNTNNSNNIINSNNTTNTTNITNNITINGLGNENITYLTSHPNFENFMIRCIRGKINGLMDFMVSKHFDPLHPENKNISKLNKKDSFINFFDGKKWKIKYSEDILGEVFNNINKDFSNFINNAFNEEGKIKKVWLDNFMQEVGTPLNWDLDSDDGEYEFQEDLPEEHKKLLKQKIYKLACEYIYQKSKLD